MITAIILDIVLICLGLMIIYKNTSMFYNYKDNISTIVFIISFVIVLYTIYLTTH